VINGLLIGLILTFIFELILLQIPYLKYNFWDHPKLILGHHFHHSLLGLLFVITGFFWPIKNKKAKLFLIGLGLGIIIIHTISDGRLIFVE